VSQWIPAWSAMCALLREKRYLGFLWKRLRVRSPHPSDLKHLALVASNFLRNGFTDLRYPLSLAFGANSTPASCCIRYEYALHDTKSTSCKSLLALKTHGTDLYQRHICRASDERSGGPYSLQLRANQSSLRRPLHRV
jgi:hypothetical protein